MVSRNFERTHVLENKVVNLIRMTTWLKNAGGKNAGNLHYVIENKCRKNARKPLSRDVDETE